MHREDDGAETIPERRTITDTYSHDFRRLVSAAGLIEVLAGRQRENREFAENWAVVMAWAPEIRYDTVQIDAAERLVEAVGDPDDGVLPWISFFW